MIKIEFPADRPDIARALGSALLSLAGGSATIEYGVGIAKESDFKTAEIPSKNDEAEDAPKPGSLFDEPSAGTAEVVNEVGMGQPTTQPEGPPVDASKLDLNGVAFNGAYCGEAAEPFYTTGKMHGQWKKKRGVEQEDYDAWYAAQLGDSAPAPEVNTSAAFGAPAEPVAKPETSVPTTTGEFMGWVSELQAAGRLTQEHVNQAYAANGLGINALFPPNTKEQIAANIAKLYEALSHVAA